MLVGKRGNLRQVGHAEHLLGARELLQFLPHCFGCASTDAAVNLVEHQRSLAGASAAAVAPSAVAHPLARNGREWWGTPALSRFDRRLDRKSTRLNSSHVRISY